MRRDAEGESDWVRWVSGNKADQSIFIAGSTSVRACQRLARSAGERVRCGEWRAGVLAGRCQRVATPTRYTGVTRPA
jgi:hypothetical protein